MLILTRNIGQTIYIDGQEIKIHFLSVLGNQVKVGIEAPKSISVNRREIYISKQLARKNFGIETDKHLECAAQVS